MKKKIWQRLFAIFASFGIILYSYSPFLLVPVNAQEETASAALASQGDTLEPQSFSADFKASSSSDLGISPTMIPEVSVVAESSPSASLEFTSTPTPEPTLSSELLWIETNGVYTTETLKLNATCAFPPNEKVSLTFSKLPENSGTITVRQIKLTQEQIDETGAFSDTAYEITSTMENGTFEYALTLPAPRSQSVEVKYSEDGQNFADVTGEKVEQDIVTITGLIHFTIFVVVGTINTNNTVTTFDESSSDVIINEFVFDSETEWVEIFNRGNSGVDLSGWMLEDGNNLTSDDLDLSGTLPPGGIFVFQRSSGWLNNTGDTIRLKDDEGNIVDQVAYKSAAGSAIVEAQDVGGVEEDESIGRVTDGQVDGEDIWQVFTEPTKGYNNDAEENGVTRVTVGEGYGYESISDAVDSIKEGGTINVLAGNYDEADIEVTTPNVTIQGPGIGQGVSRAIVNGSSCGDVSPAAIFHLHEDGITLKGFEIDGSNCGAEHAVHIGGFSEEFQVAGVNVTQNVIYSAENGVTVSLASSYDSERPNIVSENDISQNESAGVYLLSASNNIILNNDIYDNGSYGILLDDGGSGSPNNNQIINNRITGTESDSGGIYAEASLSDLTITGNTVKDSGETGLYLQQVSGVIAISGNIIKDNAGSGLYFGTVSQAQVTIGGASAGNTNTITGNGHDNEGSGIYFESIEDGSTVNILGNLINENGENDEDPGIYVERLLNNNSLTIQNNTIQGNFGEGLYLEEANGTTSISNNTISNNNSTGIFLADSVTGVTILRNTIQNNGTENDTTGIVVESASGNQAHLNSIMGNGVGIENQSGDPFNAIENWWGDSSGPRGSGPGTGDEVNSDVLFAPWCLDAECGHVFSTPPEGSLLENVSYGLPPGATLENTPSLSFLAEEIYTIAHTGGNSTVTIPTGVVITRSDNADFDASQLTSSDVDVSFLAGLSTGVVVDGALQWGLPNIELEFSDPVTLSIFVGTSFNGQTLSVVRSTTGTGGWASTGIVAPGTCVVTGGVCTFQATLASYFATNRTVSSPSSSTSSSSSGGGGGSTTSASPPVCSDTKPGGAPTLLSATPTINGVILTWSEAADPLSYYLVAYGTSSGSLQYGNPNIGGKGTTSFIVAGLSGGQTYYFKVRAGNGCTPGDYSNELSAAPAGITFTGPAIGFEEGVLGAATEEEVRGDVQGEVGETVSPTPQQPLGGLFVAIGSFFAAIASFFGKIFGR